MEKEKVLEIEFIPVRDKWAWKVKKWKLETDEVFPYLNNVFRKYGLNFYFHLHILEKPIGQDELISDYIKESMEKGMKIINEKYGKPKRWRAIEGGWYYSINISGEIIRIHDKRRIFDDDNYDFANYFQTREQAEKARELQKKAYQEVWKHE